MRLSFPSHGQVAPSYSTRAHLTLLHFKDNKLRYERYRAGKQLNESEFK